MLPSLLLLACARAVHPVPASAPPALEGPVSVVVPEGWDLGRNRCLLDHCAFELRAPDRASAITVRHLRERGASRAVPLPVVAEALAVDAGRGLGVESRLVAMHQIELAGREAWAATVARRHGPVERLESSVALRGAEHLVWVSLSVPPEVDVDVLLAWDLLLASLRLAEGPAPDVPPFAREAADEATLDAAPGWRP